MKHRWQVAIARALANDPPLLLADEPTGNLDTKASLEIMQIFKKLHADGRTIIMVTHDPEIAEYADRIINSPGLLSPDQAAIYKYRLRVDEKAVFGKNEIKVKVSEDDG